MRISEIAFMLAAIVAVTCLAVGFVDYWETGRLIISAPLVIIAVVIMLVFWITW